MSDAIKRIRDALDHGDFGPMLADDVEELLAAHDALVKERDDEVLRLRQKLRGADAFERSVSEALNSGDGSYRP